MSRLISVIVPAHNAARYIAEAISSAQAQTYRHIEIIVVDDGSRDETGRIARSLAADDPRISVLHQPNRGVASARNLAIQHSRGDFIAPLDADDVWYPEKLEKQLGEMVRGGTSTGLVYAWYRQIDAAGAYLGEGGRWLVDGHVYNPLVLQNFVGGGSMPLIRRACLDHVGLYDTRFRDQGGEGCEDWDLYLKIAEKYTFRIVPENLIKYRIHRDGMSRNQEAMVRGRRMILSEVKQRTTTVPGRILRWAEGKQCIIQLSTACRRREYRAALGLACRSLTIDPALLGAFVLEKSRTRLMDDVTETQRGSLGFRALLHRPVSVLSLRRFNQVAASSRAHAAAEEHSREASDEVAFGSRSAK